MKFYDLKTNIYKKPRIKIERPEKIGKYERLLVTKKDLTKFGDVFSVDITEKK